MTTHLKHTFSTLLVFLFALAPLTVLGAASFTSQPGANPASPAGAHTRRIDKRYSGSLGAIL